MFWKRTLAIAALALFCFAGAAPAAEDGAPKQFLWKVTGPKGVVYLLGTIHVGKTDFYPLRAIIEDSFKKADTLIEEIEHQRARRSRPRAAAVHRGGQLPDGDTITNHLSEVTRSHLAAYLKSSKGAFSEETAAHMRPWLVAELVREWEIKRMGFDTAYGLDRHFLKEAQQSHKEIGGLEDAESQLKLLSSGSEEFQDLLLLNELVRLEKWPDVFDLLTRAWQSGDADAMQQVITNGDYPQVEDQGQLDDRNTAMTAQIERFLQTPKSYFVAVGARHLIGDEGILSQLQRKNFSVEQL
jgi:uncharacterized protein YbaP (TraB family)